MRTALALALLASAVGACGHTPVDQPERGLSAVNVPVVVRSDFVLDAAVPEGMLSGEEAARVDAWFRGLGLAYGDTIYVDGLYAEAVRGDIARIAGQYGMTVSSGAPVTGGRAAEGTVRVIVSRNRAEGPNCPNWSDASQPNYQNRTMSNHGCAASSNLAAMVANPTDLVHGQEGDAATDPLTATKAINVYRAKPPTGSTPLTNINTKSGG